MSGLLLGPRHGRFPHLRLPREGLLRPDAHQLDAPTRGRAGFRVRLDANYGFRPPAIPFHSYRIHGVLLSTNPSPAPSAETTIFVSGDTSRPSLAFTARTDRATYLPGESANVTVILTNIGLETIVMHFGQPCYVQFLVLDEARHAVYNSSKWWGCVQLLTDEILAPGQSRSETFLWNLRTDAGSPLALGSQYEVVPSFLWA